MQGTDKDWFGLQRKIYSSSNVSFSKRKNNDVISFYYVEMQNVFFFQIIYFMKNLFNLQIIRNNYI